MSCVHRILIEYIIDYIIDYIENLIWRVYRLLAESLKVEKRPYLGGIS